MRLKSTNIIMVCQFTEFFFKFYNFYWHIMAQQLIGFGCWKSYLPLTDASGSLCRCNIQMNELTFDTSEFLQRSGSVTKWPAGWFRTFIQWWQQELLFFFFCQMLTCLQLTQAGQHELTSAEASLFSRMIDILFSPPGSRHKNTRCSQANIHLKEAANISPAFQL